MKKKYLITYREQNIVRFSVAEILETSEKNIINDIDSTEKTVDSESTILHFDNLGISVASLTNEQVEKIAEKKEVLAVEEDLEMEIQGFITEESEKEKVVNAKKNLWNIEMVKAPEAWDKGFTGRGVNLAILDTGIAEHPDLVISGGVSFVPGQSSYDDKNGHGTHCAGIAAGRKGLNKVYGVAKNCNLYAVKVLGDDGTGFTSWIIKGMEWCIENKIAVASMSLGSSSNPSIAYSTAVKRCQDKCVTIVCATGNGYKSSFPWVGSPANSYISGDANAQPIAVGAINSEKVITSFSSRGTNGPNWNPVSVVAPGKSIYSTYLNNGYKEMSGTSMACPHVAGLVALLYEKKSSITSIEARAMISSTASALGNKPIPNETYGYGLINSVLAIIETV